MNKKISLTNKIVNEWRFCLSSYTLLDIIAFDSKLVKSVYFFSNGSVSDTRIFAEEYYRCLTQDSNIWDITITIRKIHVLVLVTMTLSIQWLGSSSVGPSTVPSYYPPSLFVPLCTYPTLQPPLCNPLGSRSSQISVWNFQERPFRFPFFATLKVLRYMRAMYSYLFSKCSTSYIRKFP